MVVGPVARSRWGGRVRRWLPAFAGALAVRLLYWAVVTPDWVPRSDADQYLQLARNLANGLGFSLQYPQLEVHPTAFRPPLYPALLTPGALLAGDALWPARLLQSVVGSATVVLAGVFAARVGGRRAGLATAALMAVYPPLLANDTVTLTEPLALGLLLSALLLADERRWVGAGVVGGLLLLTRPNGYFVVAILALWAARRVGWRKGVGLFFISALALLPWVIRNEVQVGTWKATTSDGFTMAAIYGRPAQAAGHFIDPTEAVEYRDPEHLLARFDEAGWSDQLMEEAVDAIEENPSYAVHVVSRNLGGHFEFVPRLNVYPELSDGRNMDFRRATMPIYWLVTTIGLVGVVQHRRNLLLRVLALVVVQYVVLSLFLVAPPRLRAPFDLLCCIGSGLVIGGLWGRWSDGERSLQT